MEKMNWLSLFSASQAVAGGKEEEWYHHHEDDSHVIRWCHEDDDMRKNKKKREREIKLKSFPIITKMMCVILMRIRMMMITFSDSGDWKQKRVRMMSIMRTNVLHSHNNNGRKANLKMMCDVWMRMYVYNIPDDHLSLPAHFTLLFLLFYYYHHDYDEWLWRILLLLVFHGGEETLENLLPYSALLLINTNKLSQVTDKRSDVLSENNNNILLIEWQQTSLHYITNKSLEWWTFCPDHDGRRIRASLVTVLHSDVVVRIMSANILNVSLGQIKIL